MKKKILLTLFVFATLFVNAQTNWLKRYGNLVNEEILDAVTDQNGDIISVGYFSGPTTIGTTNLTTYGNSDILVMKTTSTGTVIWAVKAGGTGADRAYSVAVDDNGNAYITGYFYNSATFGTLTAAGQDRDVFAAKIDANGNFLWVQNCGGQFGDTGYGIEVDQNENVYITGQYRGNGVFGPANFVSMVDPNTGANSYDFFLSKLDALGNFVWTRVAQAEYDDRGLSLTIDDQNNIYVAGQFSDTIVFQNVHNNQAMNAGFLIKYDELGNEIWFDKYRAAQVILYDVKWQNDNIYLTGDFKGNMQVSDANGNHNFLSGGEYNVMVSKSNEDGILSWFSSNFSENEITSKQLVLDSNNDIYLAGLFKCDFTQMNEIYGNSTFLSVGYRDVHYIKYKNDGEFLWARQFGSNEDDYCSAIVMNGIDHPVLAGSFDHDDLVGSPADYLMVPVGSNFTGCTFLSSSGDDNCGDNNYGEFCGVKTLGGKDIFLTDPFDINRLPYDYYNHQTACDYDTLVPCIEDCQDSMAFCNSAWINVNHHQLNLPVRPKYHYLWQNGSDSIATYAATTGFYSVKISRQDGCATYNDTMHVMVHQSPALPLISDNWGYFLNYQGTAFIDTCYQDSLQIWTVAADTITQTLTWNNGIFVNDSTQMIDISGQYVVTAVSAFGCSSASFYNIILDDFAIHDTLDPQIHFTNTTLETTDTIYLCEDFAQTSSYLLDHNYISTSGGFPYKASGWYLNGGFIDSLIYFPDSNYNVILNFGATGNYSLDVHLVNECGDSIDYYMHRDFYVVLIPDPYINIISPSILGNYCPGDTAHLIADTYSSNISWSGPFIDNWIDSISTILYMTNQLFYATVDTVTPWITCVAQDSYNLVGYPVPQIEIVGIAFHGGIVCPGDSVELHALGGTNWEWVGPQGTGYGTSQNIWVDLPGLYHCIVTDIYGCIVTSNFVEVKEYSSPFMIVEPPFICEGETAEITVVANPYVDIIWYAPLSGNSYTQIVDTAGVYYCETNFCNITLIDSVIVSISIPVATITPFPDAPICPSDTITLFANGGMANYWWNGSSEGASIYETSLAGQYILTIENEWGCIAQDTVVVEYITNPLAPVGLDVTVCAGEDVVLIASASDTIYWYSQSGNLLNIGDTLIISSVPGALTFNLQNKDSSCFSTVSQIDVLMGPSTSSIPPIDTSICFNNSVMLETNSSSSVIWFNADMDTIATTPNFTSPVLMSDTIYYFQITTTGLCATNLISANVTVIQNNYQPMIIAPSIICQGDSIAVSSGDSGVSSFEWFSGTTILSTASTMLVNTDSAGLFNYGLILTLGNCLTDTGFFAVTVSLLPQVDILALSSTLICPGDSVILVATTNADSIFWPSYYSTNLSLTVYDEYDYYYEGYLNGCIATSDIITVVFNAITNFSGNFDTTICESESTIFDVITTGNVIWFDENLDTLATTNTYTSPTLFNDTYFYFTVTDSGLCASQLNVANVNVIETNYVPDYTGVTDLCIGDSIVFIADDLTLSNYLWLSNGDTVSTNFGVTMPADSAGNVNLILIVGTNNCWSDTAFIDINIQDVPVFILPADTVLCYDEQLVLNTDLDYTFDWFYDSDSIAVDTILVITFTNQLGCTFTDTLIVNWMDCNLFLPNVFTPDGDGVNDVLKFSAEKGEILNLKILNRWGVPLYESEEGEWDGTDKSGSESVSGTYFYVVEYQEHDGKIGVEQGWFFLSRK